MYICCISSTEGGGLSWGGSRGGPGVQAPPPGPQRGGPGPLFQNEENSIYYLQLIKLLCYFPYPYPKKYILKILIDLHIDLGEKQKHIYLLCELHKITSRKYEGMFLLEKKWKNSVKKYLFIILLWCLRTALRAPNLKIFVGAYSTPLTPSGNFGPVN